MLTLHLSLNEYYVESKQTFVTQDYILRLEHSLYSIAKWESKWKRPFASDGPKTSEETIDYIRCMTLGEVDDSVYSCLTTEAINEINEYISDSMTATWFTDDGKRNREIMTAERIYYIMTVFNIPAQYQYWHFNRLLTLIRVCSEENKPKKKMSQAELIEHHRALNRARRRKKHG